MPTGAIPEARQGKGVSLGAKRPCEGERGANEHPLPLYHFRLKEERSVFFGTMRSDYG